MVTSMASTISRILPTVAFCISVPSFADDLPDPFDITRFDTNTAHFEKAPETFDRALNLECGRCWLFAAYEDATTKRKYVMIFGLRRTDIPKPKDYVADSMDRLAGTLAYYDGVNYKALAVPDRFADPRLRLPQHVVVGLAHDGVARLIRAYGSKEALKIKMTDTWKHFGGVARVAPATLIALREVGITNAQESDDYK